MIVVWSRLAAAAALVLPLLGGCSGVRLETDSDPDIDFASYRTFWQAPPPKSAESEIPRYTTIMGEHISIAIAHELERDGLVRVSKPHADIIVAFSIDGEPRRDIEWEGGWSTWYAGNTYTVDDVPGVLTIDVFDAGRKRLVWHAYSPTTLYGGSSRKRETVDDAVARIMEKYPPRGR